MIKPTKFNLKLALLTMLAASMMACGGGDGGGAASGGDSNQAPVANAGDNQQLTLNFDNASLDASASSDPEGAELTYQWELLEFPAGSAISLTATDTVTTGFAPDVLGLYRVRLTVSDGELSHATEVDINVVANEAPIANPGANQQLTLSIGSATLDASASSDPEGHSMTYLWELIAQPVGSTVTLSTTDTITTDFTPDVVGTYVVQLTVSDGDESGIEIVEVDVASNGSPTARAGADQNVNRGDTVTLDGTNSSDPEGEPLTYRWIQLTNNSYCPDITGGVGYLTGATPSFTAPNVVCSMKFRLRVNDGNGESFGDQVVINMLEDRDNTLFVNGRTGSDANPGTRSQPFQSIQFAIDTARDAGNGADVYVINGTYNIDTLNLAEGVSLYGGYRVYYGHILVRNRTFTTRLNSGRVAIRGNTVSNVSIDGFVINSADATATGSTSSYGLLLNNGSNVNIANNTINSGNGFAGNDGLNGNNGRRGGTAGDGAIGNCDDPAGNNFGLRGVVLDRFGNEFGSAGGHGGNGGAPGSNNGAPGADGSVNTSTFNYGLAEPGLGGAGGSFGNPGRSGGDGTDGTDGDHGSHNGLTNRLGSFLANGYEVATKTPPIFLNRTGKPGGGGGGGGGGGAQNLSFPANTALEGAGNGGGGGGGGGDGGTSGTGATGGGGSFGLYLFNMTNTQVLNNTINAGDGGQGGRGGRGGLGGAGGAGGAGATHCTGQIGAGGNGGRGGNGGNGGHGAQGAGGPSIGISHNGVITESGNTITVAPVSIGGAAWTQAPAVSAGRNGLSTTIRAF